jgi:hypothetical protein
MRPRFGIFATATILGLLAGCTRPSDPLDWKIDAPTPGRFNAWAQESLPYLTSDLRDEFNHVWHEFVLAGGRAGYARSMDDSSDPVCRRINGHTIRQALQYGYELEKERLNRKIDLESELLLHDLQKSNADENSSAPDGSAALIALRRREIEQTKHRVEEVTARLAQISAVPK